MPHAHIILTRFNLPTKGREEKYRNAHEWLKKRIKLFESFCLPSVLGQSNQNFYWLILFDKNTREPFRSYIENYTLENSQIKILWTESASLKLVQKSVYALVPDNTKYLITTRLDNDDAISRDFIKTIQTTVSKFTDASQPYVVNYDDGVTFTNGRSYSHQDKSNAFASLVEPFSKKISTIWCYKHTELNRFGKIVNLKPPMMWIQVIHGNNVSNRIRGYRIRNDKISDKFDLRITLPLDENNLHIGLENIFISPIRFIKEYFRAKLKSALALITLVN